MASPAYQKLRDTNLLPSPTGVALELLRLVGDEDTKVEVIATVVESDPALAGRMLKLVNSPFVGVARRVVSISVAVRLLGLRTVKNLALGLSLVTSNRNGRCQAFDYEGFWSGSLARAVAARQLAAFFRNFPPDEAFAAGLLSKVGRLGLAAVCPEEYARVLREAASAPSGDLLGMERQAFGIDHQELSAELMADWHLDELFCEAVRAQDSPPAAGSQPASRAGQLARILHLADSIAAVLLLPQTPLPSLLAMGEEADTLGLAQEKFDPLFDSIRDEWREAGKFFSITTQDTPSLADLRARCEAACAPADGAERAQAGLVATQDRADALRILVVDDDPAALRLLERYLTSAGYQVTTANNGAKALEIDQLQPAQMIITDWIMPEIDGLGLCRRLRAHDAGFVYIIVLTAQPERDRVVEALKAGADDFAVKPCTREELLAHVRAGERIVRLEANLAERSREIFSYNARLAAANEKLSVMATTDELTGLANRREGLARLAEHWSLSQRYSKPLACISIDIDHFKQFNDSYGHSAGDTVLSAVADTLRKTARTGEPVCRMGGEEFLIICPEATAGSAAVGAERVRSALASTVVRFNEQGCSIHISAGVAERTNLMRNPDDLLKAADDMLYVAKRTGRNRVCAAVPACSARSED